MEPLLLIAPPKSSHHTLFPIPIPLKSSIFPHSQNFSKKTHLSFSENSLLERSSFWGQSLNFHWGNSLGLGNVRKTHVPIFPIRAAVKRRKEASFDNVIQRDKKLKLVLKLRKILVSQPNREMALKDLGKHRRELGLKKGRRMIALLSKFPAVFEIVRQGVYSLKFRLTPEAENLYLEEMKIRNGMEDILVVKLRKLLMMSLEKRILLEKIAHLRTDLGLPLEFRDTVCQRYPQYFKVVRTDGGPALELTRWDPKLAVSAAEMYEEERHAKELEERNFIIDRPLKFDRVKLPRGVNLSKADMRRLVAFKNMPYISPYSDFSELRPGTQEKEKHACGVVHELLSLTVEKRTLVDHLTHFREEFRFSQQLRGMLIRHPDMFYVSLKGDRDSVFLREAYRGSYLDDVDDLLLVKEKMRALVEVPRYPKGPRRKIDLDGAGEGSGEQWDEGSEEDGEEWSDDIENLLDDDLDDNDEDEGEDYEEDWSSEEDDVPPSFDEDGDSMKVGSSEPVQRNIGVLKKSDEERVLVLPDGRPRERW